MVRVMATLCSCAMVMAAAVAFAADFPPVADLPARPELPDPLTMLDGTRITTAAEWNAKRKPELQALFQHYMYGELPPKPARWIVEEVLFSDKTFLGGRATLSESRIAFFGPDLKQRLHVLLVVPNQRTGPAPIFVGMNFCGNHALAAHPGIHLPESWVYKSCAPKDLPAGANPERASEQSRGSQADVWNLDLIVDRGYALACFYSGDIDPDTADFSDGIEPSFYKPGQTGPGPSDAGAIAAWAWGYHRVVDFLVEKHSQAIDVKRIAAVGHSRNGKTTLLAAALDDRIALAIPHQAGCGGTAPSRVAIDRKDVETIRRINTVFPHWFCDNFVLFNETPEKIPFDQHCLLALCAPRPVLYSNAQEDQWANPDGQFEMMKAAQPVYRLLGSTGLGSSERPPMRMLLNSPLGYFIRPGKHSMDREDWGVFLDFADKQLGTK
jgi:hypothetical protein